MKMHKRNIGCILAFHFIYQMHNNMAWSYLKREKLRVEVVLVLCTRVHLSACVHIGNKTKNVTYHVFKRHI